MALVLYRDGKLIFKGSVAERSLSLDLEIWEDATQISLVWSVTMPIELLITDASIFNQANMITKISYHAGLITFSQTNVVWPGSLENQKQRRRRIFLCGFGCRSGQWLERFVIRGFSSKSMTVLTKWLRYWCFISFSSHALQWAICFGSLPWRIDNQLIKRCRMQYPG